jgi:hypothetical protein
MCTEADSMYSDTFEIYVSNSSFVLVVSRFYALKKKGVSRNPRGFHALKKGFVKN